MPYCWETEKWLGSGLDFGRLLVFNRPPASGLCAVLAPENSDGYYKPTLLDGVGDSRKEQLRAMFEDACDEETHRKLDRLLSIMGKMDGMIQQLKAGEQVDGATLQDLTGLWYVLRALRRALNREEPNASIQTFMREYSSDLLPALRQHLPKDYETLLEQLLLCPGIGPINIGKFKIFSDQCKPCQRFQPELLQPFFDKISQRMTIKFLMQQVGSVGENCKIGYDDEYDLRLEFQYSNENFLRKIRENPGLIHVSEICDSVEPSPLDIHEEFVWAARYVRVTNATIGELTLLDFDDINVPVPWLLFKWHPHPSQSEMLIKVDAALVIPCPGVWPGDKVLDPLGRPIQKIAHLMIPNPNGVKHRGHQEWRWSVCHAQQTFFKCLPKYAKLGYMICKIISSQTLFPESCGPPSTFCLKNCLFNAIANRDIEIRKDITNKECMLSQAIRVADAIVATLDKAQLSYFYDGEPTEHLRGYIVTRNGRGICRSFMAQHLLRILVEDYTSVYDTLTVDSLIPATMRVINGIRGSDLDVTRDMLGLLRVRGGMSWSTLGRNLQILGDSRGMILGMTAREKSVDMVMNVPEFLRVRDSWSRVARDAGNKWAHHIPMGVSWLWEDAKKIGQHMCLADLEGLREIISRYETEEGNVVRHDQYTSGPEHNIAYHIMQYALHKPEQGARNGWVKCYCELDRPRNIPTILIEGEEAEETPYQTLFSYDKQPFYSSLGEAYEACDSGRADFINEVTQAMKLGINNWEEGVRSLNELRKKFKWDISLFNLIASGHIVSLSSDTLQLWKQAWWEPFTNELKIAQSGNNDCVVEQVALKKVGRKFGFGEDDDRFMFDIECN